MIELYILGERSKELICLLHFFLKLSLFAFQCLDLCLTLCFDLFILGLDLFGLLAGFDIRLLETLIAVHYLADVIKCSQKIRKIGALEDEAQIVVTAVLFHRTNSFAISPELFVLFRLCCIDFQALFRDHLLVEIDHIVVQRDLLV